MRDGLRLALTTFTVVPLRGGRIDRSTARIAMALAPAVGALLGVVLGGVALGLRALHAPPLVLGGVVVAVGALLTRGLHLDGLADTCDGLLGGHDRARRLEIMRDPRVGTFGVAAVALVLLLKWSAVMALTASTRVAGLALAPMLGRCAMVVVAAAVPYARPQGLGAGYHEAARGVPLFASLVAGPVVALLACGPAGLALAVVAVLVAMAMAWWARAALGGATGDVYGATCELVETVVLLGVAAGQAHGWLAPWAVRP